jgi:hypothetical protein
MDKQNVVYQQGASGRLTPVVLAMQEAEIRRIKVQRAWANSSVRPYPEKILHKKRAGGVVQAVGPEFKPQYHQKKKKCNIYTVECYKPTKKLKY